MNILYICTPNSIHDYKWISFFSELGYNCFAVTDEKTNSLLLDHELVKYKRSNINLLEPISDGSLKNITGFFKSIKHLRKIVKENNIDFVHCLFGCPFPLWLNFLPNVKKGVTTRGSDVLVMLPELNKTSILKPHIKLYHWLVLRGYKKSDFVTSTSMPQVEQLKSFGIDTGKLNFIKTGVNIEEINDLDQNQCLPADLRGKQIILSPRFLRPLYNVEYQIEAIKNLPDTILKDYLFVFIRGGTSSDEYKDYYNQLLNEVSGLKYMIFEHLEQVEMWSIMKTSKLVLIVPKSDGTPNSAIETMAAKTPLIMGDLDYDKLLFGEAAEIVELSDSNSLTSAIVKCLLDYPNDRVLRAYDQSLKYANRAVEMDKLKKLYESHVTK